MFGLSQIWLLHGEWMIISCIRYLGLIPLYHVWQTVSCILSLFTHIQLHFFPLRDWPLHPDYFNQLLLPILFWYFWVLYFSYTCLACFCTQPLFQCLASVSVYAMVFHQVLAFAHFGSVSPFGLILVFDSWVIYDCEFSFCLISDNSEPAQPVVPAPVS